MKNRFLFPNHFNIIGWFLAVPGLILGYLIVVYEYSFDFVRYGPPAGKNMHVIRSAYGNFTDEIALTLVIVGLLFIAFSKQKFEDELVGKLRLDALYWAIVISYITFIASIILVIIRGIFLVQVMHRFTEVWHSYLDIMTYNLFTPLIIFIIRFYYLLFFKKDTYIVPSFRFLSNRPYRKIGIFLTLIFLPNYIRVILPMPIVLWMQNLPYNFLYQFLAPFGLISGLIFWSSSKNKHEDELTAQYRAESIQLAVLVNYGLLLLANFTIYEYKFIFVLISGFFSLLLLFVMFFTYACNKNSWLSAREIKGGLLS